MSKVETPVKETNPRADTPKSSYLKPEDVARKTHFVNTPHNWMVKLTNVRLVTYNPEKKRNAVILGVEVPPRTTQDFVQDEAVIFHVYRGNEFEIMNPLDRWRSNIVEHKCIKSIWSNGELFWVNPEYV